MNKETKLVVKAAIKRGWVFKHGKKHHSLTYKNGRKVSVSGSPSCRHSYKNLDSDIRAIEQDLSCA